MLFRCITGAKFILTAVNEIYHGSHEGTCCGYLTIPMQYFLPSMSGITKSEKLERSFLSPSVLMMFCQTPALWPLCGDPTQLGPIC